MGLFYIFHGNYCWTDEAVFIDVRCLFSMAVPFQFFYLFSDRWLQMYWFWTAFLLYSFCVLHLVLIVCLLRFLLSFYFHGIVFELSFEHYVWFFLNVLDLQVSFSVSSLIPRKFIQSSPGIRFVLFVIICSSRYFVSPLVSNFAVVFLSNFILLLLTSPYSECSVRIGVNLLNICFGIKVTGDPLSIMNLTGRLLTNAVVVKNGCPSLVICFVEWTVLVMRCILFGDQSFSSVLVAFDSG